ncbi:hypothetical protein FW774_02095 (plasmid) [Pedobacter sp. BS3]|uniref:hypothetical protein n=1 Tax=Pedobacter sp. BS3 TaxID=2567937 RepID=UPI0011ED1D9B|nr:hypothetical protein [Pedobacter sp. BS3]TZF85884.1 hypothetical protein FW774_02095 [Pedobacter sp. BS3]
MKKVTRWMALSLAVALIVSVSSCKKDKDSPNGTHKIVYKAEISGGGQISTAIFTNAQGDQTTQTDVNTTTWTSAELTIPESVQVIGFGCSGSGATASSTLKIQIYVDGNLVKENTGTGTILTASTTYSF